MEAGACILGEGWFLSLRDMEGFVTGGCFVRSVLLRRAQTRANTPTVTRYIFRSRATFTPAGVLYTYTLR